ncbi:MAG: hybrid sensor histidine kinase/response regulator [Ignavibacteria bacterium]
MKNWENRVGKFKGSVILIVDDISENLEILGTVLRERNFQVAFASDGNQAIKSALSISPDLILLDISMPGIDGYHTCEKLKSSEATRHIPVIFLTARTAHEDIVKGFEMGGVDYITKPFNSTELIARVVTHLDLKKSKEDIELRKIVEEQLSNAKTKAEELSRFKSSLLGNLSHEFRTPLIGIIGFAQMLNDWATDPEFLMMIDSIYNSGKRLLSTLNSILDLSELEAGNLKANINEFNLSDIVQSVARLFKTDALRKQLSLIIEITDVGIIGLIDKALFDQVLIYVIDNAIKYTETGSITIKVKKETDMQDNSWGVISITDTGTGIPAGARELIFEEFRQASEGFTREFDGIGLGLTIAKKMLSLMNGKIELNSELGKGTDIKITIPLLRP